MHLTYCMAACHLMLPPHIALKDACTIWLCVAVRISAQMHP